MLDKRIERARTRHELARPEMGTIFLVVVLIVLVVINGNLHSITLVVKTEFLY